MQTLSNSTRGTEHFVVLEVHGELDLDTQDGFGEAVSRQLGATSVVLDLSRLEFLAISSLRTLLTCQQDAAAGSRRLVCAGGNAQARRLLSVSGVGARLELADSVSAATAAGC